MNEQSPHMAGSAGTLGKRPSERSREDGRLGWSEVDRVLEVRVRLVVIADSIECGDVRMAEDCVLQLIDDLDVAEFLLDVARFGGTSVTMIERVYAHLLESSAEAARQRLDAFSARLGQDQAAEAEA
jgi:hypothetical protein